MRPDSAVGGGASRRCSLGVETSHPVEGVGRERLEEKRYLGLSHREIKDNSGKEERCGFGHCWGQLSLMGNNVSELSSSALGDTYLAIRGCAIWI